MIHLSERHKRIAKMLGLEISEASTDHPYAGLKVQYLESDASAVFDDENCKKLLDFLNDVRLARLASVGGTLEERVLRLENAVFNQQTTNQAPPDQPVHEARDDTLPTLDELRVRAAKIGTEIINKWEYGYQYSYKRPRFYIPGAKRKYCFVLSNALEPKRHRSCAHLGPVYAFEDCEYPLLVKWVEHDEEIYTRLSSEREGT